MAEYPHWNKGRKRWEIDYRGIRYTQTPKRLNVPRTREQSETAARDWWRQKRASIDRICRLTELQTAEVQADLDAIQELNESGKPAMVAIGMITERKRARKASTKPSVATYIQQTLADERARTERGELQVSSYGQFQRRITHFQEWLATKTLLPMDQVEWWNEVKAYRDHLATLIADGSMATGYANHHLTAVVKLLKLAVEDGTIDVPRFIATRKRIKFKNKKTAKSKIKNKDDTWENDLPLLRRVVAAATPRTKLYILLSLNCGYGHVDTSQVGQDEHRDGRIIRKRCKTHDAEHTPEVNYKLWDETEALMRKFRATKAAPVNRLGNPVALTNEDGKMLVVDTIKADGKESNTNNIKTAWARVKKLSQFKGAKFKPYHVLRHTSANFIQGKFGLPMAQHFLGQAPNSVAERHYTNKEQAQFDKALAWLHSELFPTPDKPPRKRKGKTATKRTRKPTPR